MLLSLLIDQRSYLLLTCVQVNHPKYNQQRVSSVRYLGELYNYRMVESRVVFRTLYSFITFGTALDGNVILSLFSVLFTTAILVIIT